MLPSTQIAAASIAACCLAVQLLAPPVVHAPAEGDSVLARSAEPECPRPQRKKKKAPAAKLTPFIGTLEEARKASREQNVPLLIHIILEDEPQNDQYRDHILPNKDLIARSVKAVVVVTNNGEHGTRKIREIVDGEKVSREVCSAYPWFDHCGQHRQAWEECYAAYHEQNGEMRCPQTLILLPDGKESWRFNTANPPAVSQVISELTKAQKRAGPGLTRDELGKVKKHAADARRETDGELWGDAWRSWNGILAIISVGSYAEEAKKALPGIEAGMKKELDQALALLIPGKAAEGYAMLDKLAQEWASSPKEGEVRRLMARAAKDKAIKEEIAVWKLEREGETLWNEAAELRKKGDTRGAEKLIRKLKRKKFEGTKIAQRAHDEYPDL